MPASALFVRAALTCAAASAAVAGCGSAASTTSGPSGSGRAATPSTAAAPGAPSAANGGAAPLTPTSTPLGQVLAASGGRVVYILQKGGTDVPCAGACAAVWPPVSAAGKPVSAGGHAVYTFTGDSGAGQTHGQGIHSFGGVWQAVAVGGTPVPLAGASSAPSSSGGGYGGY